jgi:hypothetical protein
MVVGVTEATPKRRLPTPHGYARPNEMRISCGPSCRRPHKPLFHRAPSALRARAEPGSYSARRLHARVRRQPEAELRALSLAPLRQPARCDPSHACSRERLAKTESPELARRPE